MISLWPIKSNFSETVIPQTPQDQKFWKGFGFFFALFFAAAVFVPLSLSVLPAAFALLASIGFYLKTKTWPLIDWPLTSWILLLILVMLESVSWSIAPDESLSRAAKIAPLLFFSLPLFSLMQQSPDTTRSLIKSIFPFPLIIMGTILFIELNFDFPAYRFFENIPEDVKVRKFILNKYVSTFMLLAPFGILFSIQNKRLTHALLIFILMALNFFVTESQSSQLAVIVMFLSILGLIALRKAALYLALALTLFVFILIPWISPIAFDAVADSLNERGSISNAASSSSRLENWDFISRKILEKPVTGFGMDATRNMVFDTEQRFFKKDTILHPHNIALQFWIEFGIFGVIWACGFLIFLYRRMTNLPFEKTFLPFCILSALMVFLMVSWSVWAGWLVGLTLTVGALLSLATESRTGQVTS